MTQDNWDEGKEVESNWFKFLVVGDKIKGTLVNKSFNKSNQPGFQDQWVYELKKSDGNIFNVGIPVTKSGTVQRLNNCKMGEIVGIIFDKEGEQGAKGFAKAKLLKVFTFGMDPDYKAFEETSASTDAEINF